MQCDPNVMRGLQEIIPGCRTNIEMRTLAGDEKKVSISIKQARKELKGRGATRKNPFEMPSFDDNTPPTSNFLSNAGNRVHHNRLSSAPLQPVMLMTGTPKATASSPPPMMERVQKRVMDKLFDAATTPQTKRIVAKVHAQLTQKDAPSRQDVLSSLSPKLIHVNEPPSWHLKNDKGGGQFQNPHTRN